ncbi:MAG: hypothetical protein IPM22_00430 [Betaproteobacteria bacterium]|nr:hypothetical protein [Betaproteobacteria bacterium]
MVRVHRVPYDRPPTAPGPPAGAARGDLPPVARRGTIDWRRPGYGGPCPPIGRHGYFH